MKFESTLRLKSILVEHSWQPSISVDNLKKRAQLLSATRAFFSARDVCEVQTPIIATAGNPDPHIEAVAVDLTAGGYGAESGYLNTSPEFCMKRLLAAGSGDIYQLCPAFRAGEAGRWHNPEFMILEWYRLGYSMRELMQEVGDLISHLASADLSVSHQTWAEIWAEAGLDCGNASALTAVLEEKQFDVPSGLTLSELQDLVFSLVVQPHLGRNGLCFMYHYPAEQASLARLNPDNPAVAERFECFWQGVELANGFVELSDGQEQRRRFNQNNLDRSAVGLDELVVDELFLAALESGLPDCAGVAVGFDRLAALLMQQNGLQAAISFSAQSC